MHEAAAAPEKSPFGLFGSREEMAQDHWKLLPTAKDKIKMER